METRHKGNDERKVKEAVIFTDDNIFGRPEIFFLLQITENNYNLWTEKKSCNNESYLFKTYK